jgi:hypothetical protein
MPEQLLAWPQRSRLRYDLGLILYYRQLGG